MSEMPVDPRFRRRWADARRQEGRRRLRALTGLVVACLVLGAGVGLVHSPLFKVRHVLVYGNSHTTRAEVLSAAGLATGDGATLMVDSGSRRERRSVDALPWVSTVTFSRHWPWTLSITVTERAPAALVPSAVAGVYDVVDRTGRVLEVLGAREERPSLPVVPGLRSALAGQHVLPGPGTSENQMRALLGAAWVAPTSLSQRGLELSFHGTLGLVAKVHPAKALILLGNTSQISMKLDVLQELARRVNLSGYSQVDLTVPQRPALTPLDN